MRRINVFAVLKYVAVFAFVIWIWESRSQDEEAFVFWCLWGFAVLYGGYSFVRSGCREYERNGE